MTINEYEEMINTDEYYETANDFAEQYVFFENDEMQILLDNRSLYIKDANIIIKEGVELYYDEDSEEYEPDCDITMFFDLNTKKFLYSETEIGVSICLSNYCNGIGTSYGSIGDMELEIVNDEEIYDESYEG